MTWAHYLLQVNIYLVIFYAFYQLLLNKETYFMLNRLYLILAGILSLTIPFMKPEWFMADAANHKISISADQLNILMANVSLADDPAAKLNWGALVAAVYLTGVVVFTIRLLIRLFAVRRLISANPSGMAFSFLNKTVIDNNLPGQDTIHMHEEIHIRQYHTLDILFFELLCILVWCNPVIYLYKITIRNIHEYIADEQAALFQGDKESYAMLLLSKAFGIDQNILTNSFFNQSLIKKRIFMLNKQRSKKVAILKYGLFLPLFAVMLLLSSATISRNEEIKSAAEKISAPLSIRLSPDGDSIHAMANNDASKPIDTPRKRLSLKQVKVNTLDTVGTGKTGGTSPDGGKLFDFTSITRPPSFPGGMEKFYKYLAASCRYPEEAVKNNVQGKVFLSFIVEKDGALSDIKVQKKLGSGTDEEAIRLLKGSPKWTPGYSGDQPVRVMYNLPIAFTLSDRKTEQQGSTAPVVKIEVRPASIYADRKSSGNPPIYFVDGVRHWGALEQINPNDIESISVLKDQSATEKYGDEGKDGVILIVTKKGKAKNPASVPATEAHQ